MSKKILAVILSLILVFSAVSVPASAASILGDNFSIENTFNTIIDKLISFVLTYLNKYWPGYEDKWDTEEDYVTDNFYAGDEVFDNSVSADGAWEVGYSSASLLDGIEPLDGDYYLAGTLEPIVGRVPTKILDDQRVRVYAISDGDGIVLQATIDGFGLARGDVMEIRTRMAEFAETYGIKSINVSVLHQHSCIDTLGMNVPLAPALILNTGNAAAGGIIDQMKIQKNEQFMENLFAKTVYAMKTAVKNMKEGTLYYGTADVHEYIKDKRDPQSYDGNIHRLRFVPEDGTRETWLLQGAIHCTSIGAGPDQLTGDYPYYIEKTVKEEVGANVIYVMGAELAVTSRRFHLCDQCDAIAEITENSGVYTAKCPNGCGDAATAESLDDLSGAWNELNGKDMDGIASMEEYGFIIANKVIDITNDVALDPVLNIKMAEVTLSVDNEILTLAAREDILNAVIVKSGDDYKMITEIGYMELGNKVAVFICPGEFEPAIFFGGPESGDAAWSGAEWGYAPLKDMTTCENVMVFGLNNDQAGYVLKDNEYHSLLTENEEINVVSKTAGSTFVTEYIELIDSTIAA